MIETLIFDCEGVIIDSEAIWDHGQRVFLQRRGFVYDRSRIKPLLTGRSLAEGVLVLQEQYGFDGDPEALAQERLNIVRELFAQEVQFIPGFLEFYSRVHERFRTCVATALDPVLLESVDKRLHLSQMFNNKIFTLANVGFRGKPAPDLFLYASRVMGSLPEKCLVLEDAPHGIEAARRAGMPCIGIATTYSPELLRSSDMVVRYFSEIDLECLPGG